MPPRAARSPRSRSQRTKSPSQRPSSAAGTPSRPVGDTFKSGRRAVTAHAPKLRTEDSALTSDSEFKRSVAIYLSCVLALAASLAAVLQHAPPAPSGGVCDGVSIQILPDLVAVPDFIRKLGVPTGPFGSTDTAEAAIVKMW